MRGVGRAPNGGDQGRSVGALEDEGGGTRELYTQKKRPPSLTGAKLPWFSRVARALLAANGGVAVGAEGSLRGVATQHYCCTAPVEDAIPWGDVVPWAAKLFSINLMCTVLGTRSR